MYEKHAVAHGDEEFLQEVRVEPEVQGGGVEEGTYGHDVVEDMEQGRREMHRCGERKVGREGTEGKGGVDGVHVVAVGEEGCAVVEREV